MRLHKSHHLQPLHRYIRLAASLPLIPACDVPGLLHSYTHSSKVRSLLLLQLLLPLSITAAAAVPLCCLHQGPAVQQLTGAAACGSLEEVLLLEAGIWQQLDILTALSARVKGRRHALPFGLLQLRPPSPQVSVVTSTLMANKAAAAAAAVNGGEGGGVGRAECGATAHTDAAADGNNQPVAASGSSHGISQSHSGSSTVTAADGTDQHHPHTASEATQGSSSNTNLPTPTSTSSSTDIPTPSSSSSSTDTSTPTSTPYSTSSSSSSSSQDVPSSPREQWSSSSQYAFAASEGMDIHADPLWPPLRRAARLSWAAALVTGEFDLDKGPQTSDLRQLLLETPSIASRLRYVLEVLQRHAKVLAALAAVKDVQH